MGIEFVREVSDNRSGAQGLNDEHKYTRKFHVYTDGALVGAKEVLAADGIPLRRDPYQTGDPGSIVSDELAIATEIKAEQEANDHQSWYVTVEYERAGNTTHWDVQWSFQPYEMVLKADRTPELEGGPKQLRNSAGDPFDPPVTVDDSRPVLTITRIEDDFDFAAALEYKDAVNSDEFVLESSPVIGGPRTVAPYTAKMANIGAVRVRVGDVWKWRVTYEIHFRPFLEDGSGGWEPVKFLDQGFRELDDNVPPKPVQIVDKFNHTAGTASLLDGLGKRLTPPTADPHYLDFVLYKRAAFTELNLDYGQDL